MTLSVPSVPEKQLKVSVTITFNTDTDAELYGVYDYVKQADVLREQLLGEDLLEILETPIADDLAIVEATVEVIEKPEPETEDDDNVEEVEVI